MKLIRQARLYFQDGKSDKVYEVDLCDLGSAAGEKRYVVNFRYGRRGKPLREGSKTEQAVDFDEAVKIFNSVVVSKTNKGYIDSQPHSGRPESTAAAESSTLNDVDIGSEVERKILAKLELARQQAISSHEAKRVVWRAGERAISAAASSIAALAGTHDAVLDYCIAWALGRCGDSSVITVLQSLQAKHGLNPCGRMAREAQLYLSTLAQRQSMIAAIKQQLPSNIAGILDNDNVEALTSQLALTFQTPTVASIDLLCDLYTISLDNSVLHRALCRVVRHLPLQANLFKALRRVFKHAEFRKDATMFGILAYRFETSRAMFYRGPYSGNYVLDRDSGRYLKFDKEIRSDSSALAFSSRTQNYLRRRSWRYLKRLGDLEDPAFATIATQHLLLFKDEDGGRGYQTNYYDYEARRSVVYKYGKFSHFIAFNQLLHRHSAHLRLSRDRNKWYRDENVPEIEDFRCEAFPQLWDQQPQQLLLLLCQSRCHPVHRFALRAIKTNQGFCDQIKVEDLALMLSQAYQETRQFAFSLAQAMVKRNQISVELLQALLSSALVDARTLAFDVINARHQWLLDNEDLLLACLCSEYEDVRLWIRRRVGELDLSSSTTQRLVARLVSYVMSMGTLSAEQKAIVADISWLFSNVFTATCREINLQVIEDLLQHGDFTVQALGARLLLQHEISAENLPAQLIRRLLEATSAEVRSIGVQLLGNLPDAILLAQPALVVQLALSLDAEVRQAARPIVKRLAAVDKEFARSALDQFLSYLFRREAAEGLHEDILQIVKTDLNHAAENIDKDTTWRLLQSKSKAAQRYGAHLLPRFSYSDFSVRQIGRLAGNPQLNVRQWGWTAYQETASRIKQQAQDALVILDSNWDDTREFGKSFFNQHFSEDDWRPDLLVSICDSVRPDIQQFGRELITRFFQAEHGVEYLTKLSEHPTTNVQLFASNYLQQYAAGDIERLRLLRGYFVTVLSQVNRARLVKSRINSFLAQEALREKEYAEFVSDIYSRQSVSDALVDKTACIKMLYQVKMRFPDISMPMKLLAPRRPVGREQETR